MSRRFRTSAALGIGIVVALAVVAPAASAHVTVHSYDATKGGYALLDFRVPNETDDAFTTKVAVTFLTPLQSASPEPIDGWTAEVVKGKLSAPVTDDDGNVTTDGVAGITWTATGKGLAPTYFQQFEVSAGPLPDQPTLGFPTLQTYSDGSVVKWVDATVAGQKEPDHPAPVLTLGTAASSSSASPAPTVAYAGPAVRTVKQSSNGLGIAGIVVGAVGILLAGFALTRKRA